MTCQLISHYLCPYVQRAAISFAEKGVPFERTYIDLSNKPDWFGQISPLGKVPVLKSADHAIFESAVILEYLEDTLPNPLHPADPLERARHRAWIEYGSSVLADIAVFYNSPDEAAFHKAADKLHEKFARLEEELAMDRGFPARSSAWLMPSLHLYSDTSTSSTKSAISAYWPVCPKYLLGA